MEVNWDYMGIRYRHTTEEIDDPECHLWQDVSPAELIVHAANLALYRGTAKRTDAQGQSLPPLWSLRSSAPTVEEPKHWTF